ncbi:MAG: MFS transporter [Pedobacter sp.]|nr:MAG: MFS transporter [Pedobacter sp.]
MFRQIFTIYKTSFSGLSRETWILSIVILVNRCGFMAVPFMGLYVTQSLGRPASDAGILISLFGVGSILGAAAGGKLTDVFGFRPVQIFSSLFGGALFLAFPLATNFTVLCVLALFISFFYDAFRPANFAAIAAYSLPGNETRSYSLNRLATNIGWAFGISMGGIIASYNYKLLFIVDGAVTMIVGFAIFLFLPAVKGFRKAVKEKMVGVVVKKPWQDGPFLRFMLLTTLFTTSAFLMFRVVPVFFKEVWHLDEALIGIILGVNGVIIGLFEMVIVSKIENKKSPAFYIILGVVIVGFSFACLMLPSFVPVVVALISVVCFTVGEMLSFPFFNTIVIQRSNEFNRGQYAAGYSLSWSVAQVVGPTFGFYVAEKLGYSYLWVIITILILIIAYAYRTTLSRLSIEAK